MDSATIALALKHWQRFLNGVASCDEVALTLSLDSVKFRHCLFMCDITDTHGDIDPQVPTYMANVALLCFLVFFTKMVWPPSIVSQAQIDQARDFKRTHCCAEPACVSRRFTRSCSACGAVCAGCSHSSRP